MEKWIYFFQNNLGLKRGEFIQLGMLAGGDYSRGLERIGVVSAVELISDFANKTKSIEQEFDKVFFQYFFI